MDRDDDREYLQSIPSQEHVDPSSNRAVEPVARNWSPFNIVVAVLSVLMILMGLLWLGATFGILAALVPDGLNFLEGWVWGTLGLVGIVLLIVVLRSIQRSRQEE